MYKYNVVFYGITIQYAYNGILLFHSININGILFSNEDTKDFVWITTNWKILKDMGIPDHLTCLLWSLYVGQEATVRTRHGTTDWFKLKKGECQSYILSPCLFNLYAEYIMWNSGLDEAQLESRLPGEISLTSDMQMTQPFWQNAKRN